MPPLSNAQPKEKAFDFTASHNVVVKDGSRAASEAGLDLSRYRHGQPLPGYTKGEPPGTGAAR